MNILVLGGGGREHAISWALAKSPRCTELYVAPGNGGTANIARNVKDLNAEDAQAVLAFAQAHNIELVVIGPEAPLVAGVADVLREAGIPVFGPDAQGAQLEGSKTYSKRFMDANGIPTARYQSFTDAASARAYCEELGAPLVVKADGLAAGKGVVVAETLDMALDAVEACFDGSFGDAGQTVVVEEMLTGPECSLLAFVSNGKAFCMAPAQDHKRAYDGDLGPNTGGMGVYSPVPFVTPEEHEAMVEIERKVVAQLAADGIPYSGCLYGGFMLTKDGPKVLEFNARFGDPETQVVLPRMKADLLDVFLRCDNGTLDGADVSWDDDWAVSVVLTSAGYPGSYEKGKPITGIEQAEELEGVTVYHAGTKTIAGELVTNGGRVLNVTAVADTFEHAREQAYRACDRIEFEGKTLRRDIGARALRGRDAWEV